MTAQTPPIEPLAIDGDEITIIDQTLLPGEERRIVITSVGEMWEAIRALRVRGAPAIGIAAAFGLDIAARQSTAATSEALLADIEQARAYLATSRPTAVNLFWALDRVWDRLAASDGDVEALRRIVRDEALAILEEDRAAGRAIGEYGAALLSDGAVLTHCNAGGLATSGYGTALAPIYVAHEQGHNLLVYADETRPLLQGARLTAWELSRAGVPVTVIGDGMAASVLARGGVQAVLVGADRVAANGDAANKIGTLPLAIVAHTLGVPVYVALPISTIDLSIATGADIPIEERDAGELRQFNGHAIVPDAAGVYNPAFDVTPHAYISAFITERGVVRPPYSSALRSLVAGEIQARSS
ncbi:MAG: S-methyl-5-thioribose-1-phosphate isomerase [Thermomicrobiales bacterium]|nr:S-methyl-5-thioribose-1-phosphate isomerase [Thermomicrobiales bacterium]